MIPHIEDQALESAGENTTETGAFKKVMDRLLKANICFCHSRCEALIFEYRPAFLKAISSRIRMPLSDGTKVRGQPATGDELTH
jgi:hypothetical protein